MNILKISNMIMFIVFCSNSLISQVRFNENVSNNTIPDDTAFLDASSSSSWNSSTNIGKGLLFPSVDLTTLAAFATSNAISPANKPNYFHGLLVFNTATGTSGIGNVEVVPGFYYYSNPGQSFPSGSATAGVWIPMKNGGNAPVTITEDTAVATHVTTNAGVEHVISLTGSADGVSTHIDLGTTILAANTVKQFRKAIVYDATGYLVIVATGSYDIKTNKFVTGNGMTNILLPAAEDYKVELYYSENIEEEGF